MEITGGTGAVGPAGPAGPATTGLPASYLLRVNGSSQVEAYDARPGAGSVAYTGATLDVVTASIVTALAGAAATLAFAPQTFTLAGDPDLPATISLVLPKGALLSPNTGVTAHINGPIDAGLYQIFGGAGTVVPARGAGTREYAAAWWGFSGSATAAANAAALNAAYTALTGIGALLVLHADTFSVTTLLPKPNVWTIGAGRQATDATHCTVIQGTAGDDVFTLPTSGTYSPFTFSDFTISGGANGIASRNLTTYVTLERLEISDPTGAGIYVEGSIEEWRLHDVDCEGGNYGVQVANVLSGGQNYVDKCTFANVKTGGQLISGWSIKCVESSTCSWIDPWIINTTQHGFQADGNIRSWNFWNVNTEGNGHNRSPAATVSTGSITSGSAALTTASSAYANGDVLTVAGAGANGTDLTATVSSGGGTTSLTLSTTAGTTVSSADVTNAVYDDFIFTNTDGNGTPSYVNFYGGRLSTAGGGGTANVRYGVNAVGANNVQSYGLVSTRPLYDPTYSARVFAGSLPLRRPSQLTSDPLQAIILGEPGAGGAAAAVTQLPSGWGTDWRAVLVDSAGNQTGTFGVFRFMKSDSNRTSIVTIDGTGNLVAHGYLQSQRGAKWYSGSGAPTISANNGDMYSRTDGATGSRLYVCAGGTTWAAVSGV